jgi:hypothetical protein
VRCPICNAELQPEPATLDQTGTTLPAIAYVCRPHEYRRVEPVKKP